MDFRLRTDVDSEATVDSAESWPDIRAHTQCWRMMHTGHIHKVTHRVHNSKRDRYVRARGAGACAVKAYARPAIYRSSCLHHQQRMSPDCPARALRRLRVPYRARPPLQVKPLARSGRSRRSRITSGRSPPHRHSIGIQARDGHYKSHRSSPPLLVVDVRDLSPVSPYLVPSRFPPSRACPAGRPAGCASHL